LLIFEGKKRHLHHFGGKKAFGPRERKSWTIFQTLTGVAEEIKCTSPARGGEESQRREKRKRGLQSRRGLTGLLLGYFGQGEKVGRFKDAVQGTHFQEKYSSPWEVKNQQEAKNGSNKNEVHGKGKNGT